MKADATGTHIHFTDAGPAAEPCVGPRQIAGLSIVEADSMDQAIDWVRGYPFAQARPEVEIHPVNG